MIVENFIKFLYAKADKDCYFCVSTKGNNGFRTLWFTLQEIKKACNFISLKTSKNIYISLNLFSYPERTKKFCINQIHNLFLDFDSEQAYRDFIKSHSRFSTVIQTSINKYQVVLKLKNTVTREHAERIARYLAHKSGSDIAATDCTRLIRMPYTYNYKYNPPFLTKIIQYATHYYTPPDVHEFEKDYMDLSISKVTRTENEIDPALLETAREIYNKILECTPPKADGSTRDYSVADARFVTCMFRKNYSSEVIARLLESVSPCLHERKNGHVEDYVSRTVLGVINYVKKK